jgi:hypothetical protein
MGQASHLGKYRSLSPVDVRRRSEVRSRSAAWVWTRKVPATLGGVLGLGGPVNRSPRRRGQSPVVVGALLGALVGIILGPPTSQPTASQPTGSGMGRTAMRPPTRWSILAKQRPRRTSPARGPGTERTRSLATRPTASPARATTSTRSSGVTPGARRRFQVVLRIYHGTTDSRWSFSSACPSVLRPPAQRSPHRIHDDGP